MGTIPRRFQRFFWDTDPGGLRWETHRDWIVRRLLAEGDWDAVVWVRRTLGDKGLREWLLAAEGRGLEPRQLRFWQLVLDLPEEAVGEWLSGPARRAWDRRGAQ